MKKAKMKKEILQMLKSKVKNTTLHGLPKIMSSKYYTLKILWLVCFLGSVGVCGWFLSQSISSYLSWQVVTYDQINYVFQQSFPVFSICNYVSFAGINQSHILRANFGTQPLDVDYEFE